MINLYRPDDLECKFQGLGVITKIKKDESTEERNGQNYHEFIVYHTDTMYKNIKVGYRIKTDTSHKIKNQIYTITDIQKTSEGSSKVRSVHISYLFMDQQIKRSVYLENTSCKGALDKIINSTVDNIPFTAYSNITTSSTLDLTVNDIDNARQALGGARGSVLDNFGGEYEFDNYKVSLLGSRGVKRNVIISYGKNLQSLEQDESISGTYTSIYPKANYRNEAGDDVLATLTGSGVVDGPTVNSFPFRKVLTVDFSDKVKDKATSSEVQTLLKKEAERYIKDNKIGYPKVKLRVSYLDLSKTLDYKDRAELEEINLCDIVTVKFEELGISVDAKVIKTVYSKSLERYTFIELGEPKYTLSDKLNDIQKDIEKSKEGTLSQSFIQDMINRQTDLITGNSGGNMIIRYSEDGKPNEILFMDTDNVNTASEVLRINRKGIGFSNKGWQGPFETAWTLDGSFNANFITSGTIKSVFIELSKKMTVEEDGFLTGSYDYEETSAVEPRRFVGDWTLGKRDLQFVGNTIDNQNNRIYYTDTTFGQDTAKFRQYADKDRKTMLSRLDITAYKGARVTLKNFYSNGTSYLNLDGGNLRAFDNDVLTARISYEGNIWAKDTIQSPYFKSEYIANTKLAEFRGDGVTLGRINALSNYSTLHINEKRGDLGSMVFGKDGVGPFVKSIDIWNRSYVKGDAIVVSTATGTIGSSTDLMQKIDKLSKLMPLAGLGKVAIATAFDKKDGTAVSWFDITI